MNKVLLGSGSAGYVKSCFASGTEVGINSTRVRVSSMSTVNFFTYVSADEIIHCINWLRASLMLSEKVM